MTLHGSPSLLVTKLLLASLPTRQSVTESLRHLCPLAAGQHRAGLAPRRRQPRGVHAEGVPVHAPAAREARAAAAPPGAARRGGARLADEAGRGAELKERGRGD